MEQFAAFNESHIGIDFFLQQLQVFAFLLRRPIEMISYTQHYPIRISFGDNVINLSCSPAQGKPPEAASRHGRRAMTRPLPLNQAV
ncbi:hypothetical protein, partial [Aquipseudomonas alcaligenes]|uniref:hypothetical protein n=1 Tax=Aquipseudomonas alcaligenes TaxID=43263 RepID=UPI001C81534B